MRILVDQDEVLAQFVQSILNHWNKENDSNVSVDDIKTYMIADTLGDKAEYFTRWCMRHPTFFQDLEPVPGAIEGMKTLHDLGHELVIATKAPTCAGIAYYGKLEWVKKHLPWFDINNFVAIQRKELLTGDVLIDDNINNISKFAATNRTAIIFDRPSNRDYTVDNLSYVTRVANWDDLISLMEIMEFEYD